MSSPVSTRSLRALRPSCCPAPTRPAATGIATLFILMLGGCQTYHPQPLELAGHSERVEARLSPASEDLLSSFAQRLEAAPLHSSDDVGQAAAASADPAGEGFALADGITSAEAEVIALFFNPDLRLARLQSKIAFAVWEHAGRWEDPVFGFDAAEVLSGSEPLEFGLTLAITVPISGRFAAEKEVAHAEWNAERTRLMAEEWAVRMSLREAWAAWTAAEASADLLDLVIEQIEHIVAITGELEQAGELTRVESRLIRVELAERRMERRRAREEAHSARLQVLATMGLAPTAAVDLITGFPAPPPLAGGNANEVEGAGPDLLQTLVQSSPAIALARAEYEIAENALRLEIRRQYPDIEIGGGYGSEAGDDRLLFGFSLPIPILNASRGAIAEARARRDLAQAAAETTLERLHHEMQSAWLVLQSTRAQREAMEREIVPLLDEQSAEIEALIKLGQVDTLLLLETVTRRAEARAALLDLQLRELAAQLEIATILGPPSTLLPAAVEEGGSPR